MEREIKFLPAPKGNYGIYGVDLRMYLKKVRAEIR